MLVSLQDFFILVDACAPKSAFAPMRCLFLDVLFENRRVALQREAYGS